MLMPDLPIPPKKKRTNTKNRVGPQPSAPRKKIWRRYAFDGNGRMYVISQLRPEQWEALQAKPGEVLEIRARNRHEARAKYQEIERQDQGVRVNRITKT